MSSNDNLGQWRESAACRDEDPELFFPTEGVSPNRAIAVCRRCPVVRPCLEYALRAEVAEWGVWGGLSEPKRRKLRGESRAGVIAARRARVAEYVAAGRSHRWIADRLGVTVQTVTWDCRAMAEVAS